MAPEDYTQGIRAAAEEAGISLGPSLPEGVEFATREKEGRRILFLLNYTDQPQKVWLGQSYHNALSGVGEVEELQLAPFDVKVLTTP
jgi:beta-galactosidase GanA